MRSLQESVSASVAVKVGLMSNGRTLADLLAVAGVGDELAAAAGWAMP
jgi:hypothetical protein